MDFIRMPPLPATLRAPLRGALAGERGTWPPLSEPDVHALSVHGMAPLAYASGRAPELRSEAMQAAAIEPLRLADLRAVLEALASERPLVIKGSALAYDVYPAPEHRPRADTDLLVRRESFERVREILTRLGFTAHLTSGDEHGLRQVPFSRVDAHGVQHAYDVHWAIANSPIFADVLRYEDVEPVVVERISPLALALPRAEALLIACVHRVAHHHDSDRLIWLADVALLRRAMAEQEHARFWRLAVQRRVAGVCMRAVELADEWFGVSGPSAETFLTPAERMHDEPSRAFLDRELTYGEVTLANLRALPWRARLTRLRQLAFPPVAFMQERFATRSRAALPWLYVRRGARSVVRLFRRIGAQ